MAVKTTKTGNGGKAATGNVYHDLAGNVLPANDKTAIAAAYVAAARTMLDPGEELAELSVDQVFDIVTGIPGNDNAADMARATAVYDYETAQSETTDDDVQDDTPQALAIRVSAYKGSAEAFKIGQAFDETTNQHFKQLADAKEDFDGAPLPIAEDMKRLDVPVLQLPAPGSRFDKPPYSTGMSNEQTDYYKVQDASGADIKGSVYADMVGASSFGRGCDRFRTLLKEVESKAPMKEGDITELNNYLRPVKMTAKDLSSDNNKLVSAKRYIDNRRNAVVQKLRKAVAYLQQEDRINALPGFKVQRIADDVEAAAKQRDPLEIVYVEPATGKIHKSKGLSLGTFIRFDVAQARLKAEAEKVPVTIGSLLETTKRKPRSKVDKAKDGTNKGHNRPLATTIYEVTDDIYSVAGYLAQRDRFASVIDACDKNPELIVAIGDLSEFIDGIMSKIDIRYKHLKANASSLRDHMQQNENGNKAA